MSVADRELGASSAISHRSDAAFPVARELQADFGMIMGKRRGRAAAQVAGCARNEN
jgi:hypothetical protein